MNAAFSPVHERSLAWNDRDIGIERPLDEIGKPRLSGKDAEARTFGEIEVYP